MVHEFIGLSPQSSKFLYPISEIFDIEVIFFLPWAVVFRRLGVFGLVEMFIFIFILLVGYIFAWKKGALEWE